MRDRARTLVEASVLALLLAAGLLVERARGDLGLGYVAFALLLAPGLFRRWLALRGRAPAVPGPMLALELASFLGLAASPFPGWAQGLAGLAALALALEQPDASSPRATLAEEAGPALGVLALGAVWTFLLERGGTEVTPVVLAALVAVEAYGPGATRTVEASSRRVAALALVLVAALLAPHGLGTLGPMGARIATVLAFLAAFVPAVLFAGRVRAPPRRRTVRIALGVALAANLYLLTVDRLIASERRVDLRATAHLEHLAGHDTIALLPRLALDYAPEDAVLSEEGAPLAQPRAMHDAIAAVGSGRYDVWTGRVVHFSSSDGSDPLTNGRRYELRYRPERFRSAPARALAGLTALLVLAAWPAGTSRRGRLALAGVVLAGFAAGLPGAWDRIRVSSDTDSYVSHHTMRPYLYPAFIDLLDAAPGEPRTTTRPDPAHPDRARRFVNVVRAQEVLTVLALAVLAWVLSGLVNVWVLGLATYLVAIADVGATASSVHENVTELLSEGLNHPLLFLTLAATLAYLARPRASVGALLALLTGLLILNRPSNGSLVAVFAVVWLRHFTSEGLARATLKVGALALLSTLPLLAGSWQHERATGFARLHTATGMHVFGTAFEVATPDDVTAFEDPDTRRFLHACLVDHAAERVDYRAACDDEGLRENYVDRNIYDIALPTFRRTVSVPPDPRPDAIDYYEEDFLLAIAKRLIARHPLAYARLVLFHLGFLFHAREHVPIAICFGLALWLYRRTRAPQALAFLYVALLPWLAMLPSCAFNFPLERYRSQLDFLERLLVVLFFAVLTSLNTRTARE